MFQFKWSLFKCWLFPPTYYQHFELGLLCSLLDPDNPLTGKPAGNTIGITMFIPSFREGAIRLGMMRSLSCVLRVEETIVCLPAAWHMQDPHALPLIANLYVYQLVQVCCLANYMQRLKRLLFLSHTWKFKPTMRIQALEYAFDDQWNGDLHELCKKKCLFWTY